LIQFCNMEFINNLPSITIEKESKSTGNLEFENFPNILTVYLGQSNVESNVESNQSGKVPNSNMQSEEIGVLETTVDDVTGENIGHIMNLLLENGALDVNFIPVQAKKNRPATLVKVITNTKDIEKIANLLIIHLGTIGVRYRIENRFCLDRKIISQKSTLFGKEFEYRIKISGDPLDKKGLFNIKIEYEDLATISKQTGKSIHEIKTILEGEFLSNLESSSK
jgi:pyridinium-3,5-bisthiocarboxylic acid mononucleotide nickel chelatase